MKRIICILILSSTFQANSQSPSIQWSRALGGTLDDMVLTFQSTNDNGAIMGGVTASKDGDVTGARGKGDIWVVKLDDMGNKQWQKILGGNSEEQGAMVYQTSDGGYIVGGNTTSTAGDVKGSHGGFDMWVVKLSPSGSVQWQKALGGSNDDEIILVQQMADGGYLVGGRTLSNNGDVSGNHGDIDIFFAKLSASGSVVWTKTLGSIGSEKLYSVQLMPDGGFVFVGNTYLGVMGNNGDVSGYHGNQDLWVGRVSAGGDLLWNRAMGGSGSDGGSLLPIKKMENGNLVVSNYYGSTDGDLAGIGVEHGGWLVCLDPWGTILWQKIFEKQTIYGMNTCADGGIITGRNISGNTLNTFSLTKISASGAEEWTQLHTGTGTRYLNILHETQGGGFIGYGTASNATDLPSYHGGLDGYLIRFDASGQKLWERAFGGTNNDFLQGGTAVYSQGIYPINTSSSSSWQHYNPLIQAADGSFLIGLSTGSSNGDINGFHYSSKSGLRFDIWLAKIRETLPSPTTLSTTQTKQVFQHRMFPNPALGYIELEFISGIDKPMVLEFYNASGQLLKSAKINPAGTSTSRFRLDVTALPPGLIHYSLIAEGYQSGGKFIKSK